MNNAWLVGGEAGLGLETLPPHEFEDSPDFSEDIIDDAQEQLVTIVPNLAISEIITMRIIDLKICLSTGIDNNAAPPKVEIAKYENDDDHTSIYKMDINTYVHIRNITEKNQRFHHQCLHCLQLGPQQVPPQVLQQVLRQVPRHFPHQFPQQVDQVLQCPLEKGLPGYPDL